MAHHGPMAQADALIPLFNDGSGLGVTSLHRLVKNFWHRTESEKTFFFFQGGTWWFLSVYQGHSMATFRLFVWFWIPQTCLPCHSICVCLKKHGFFRCTYSLNSSSLSGCPILGQLHVSCQDYSWTLRYRVSRQEDSVDTERWLD